MSAPSPVLSSAKNTSDIRFPLFSPGQMLQHDDLTALADYTRMLMQLMLKSFFGCGVICGLCVKAVFHCNKLVVTVEPGVAVDCCGNLVHVTKPVTITIDPDCDLASLQDLKALWVVLREFEKGCAPRPASCPADDEEVKNVCTREACWYEVQVRTTLPDCVCGCIERNGTDKPAEGSEASARRARVEGELLDAYGDCYAKHEEGVCECECTCAGPCDHDCHCGGEWIVLARLPVPDAKTFDVGEDIEVEVDHSVRRYVRAQLARDFGCGQLQVLKRRSREPLQDVRGTDEPARTMQPKGDRAHRTRKTPAPK